MTEAELKSVEDRYTERIECLQAALDAERAKVTGLVALLGECSDFLGRKHQGRELRVRIDAALSGQGTVPT